MCCIGGWTVPRDLSPTGWFHVVRAPRQVSQVCSPTHLLRPQQAQAPFLLPRRSSETQRAGVATTGSSSVGRAASLVVSPVRPPLPRCRAQVPSTRELETATTAVVGRPGRISEVLVTSTRPNNASQATHRARLGLKWLREWLLGEACRGWGVAQLSGEEKSKVPVPL